MNRLRPVWLLIISASAALLGLLATALMVSRGHGSPALPVSSVVTLAGVGGVVLLLGIIVWRDQRQIQQEAERRRAAAQGAPGSGRRASSRRGPRRLHPLQAVRVVAAAQACAYAGALIAGWHAGVLAHLAPAAGLGAPNASSSLVMIIGGLIWVIIGFVVEQLCRIPPEDGGAAGHGNGYAYGDDEPSHRPGSHRPEEGYASGAP